MKFGLGDFDLDNQKSDQGRSTLRWRIRRAAAPRPHCEITNEVVAVQCPCMALNCHFQKEESLHAVLSFHPRLFARDAQQCTSNNHNTKINLDQFCYYSLGLLYALLTNLPASYIVFSNCRHPEPPHSTTFSFSSTFCAP